MEPSVEAVKKLFTQLDLPALMNASAIYTTEVAASLQAVLDKHAGVISEQSVGHLFTKALGYCKDNPIQAAGLLFLFVPGAAWAPFIRLIGFSTIGPVAGSAAALFQSRFGAMWAFRIAQGAAMNGAAAGVLNGVTQGAAAIAAVGNYVMKNGTKANL